MTPEELAAIKERDRRYDGDIFELRKDRRALLEALDERDALLREAQASLVSAQVTFHALVHDDSATFGQELAESAKGCESPNCQGWKAAADRIDAVLGRAE